ncbi:MAG: UDP-N-acetylmuramoyl-L-alanyl-D-glutamate--2,6-diaminopimelate ligase [Parachlamydia sp.]|nr:UDP-N-acetylmuramoyl-L-alanyl-D-glutamate--2,6-diaminopimelate ligase [Parachlamydia sp.]
MKLKKLLKAIPFKQFKGSKEIEITGICANSKLVSPGNLFIARKGRVEDGSHYIPEAIAAGAAAILTDILDPSLKDVAQIIHPDVASLEGLIAAHYYQFPSNEMLMVGVTGTNGKTTTTFLIKHLLDQLQGPCGLIGTIEYIIGQHRYQATRTTPDVTSNHKMLREMVLQGCRSAVMEVTSHALDQGRVRNINYDITIFTNLTLDHLDYHQTMENYCAAKNRLFRSLDPKQKKNAIASTKWAIVNIDSPWHAKIVEGCPARILTYAIAAPADLMAKKIELTPDGTRFEVVYQNQAYLCKIPLVGRFNVYNSLAAIAVGLTRGASMETILDILSRAPSVPGRLQPVPNPRGLKIYVDFAHSDDALLNVLETLQELKKGRIITIFGCGGDRDLSKRPKMAQVAEEYSDIAIVTSDNPRSEDPQEIARQIVKGFRHPERHLVEVDRRAAIAKAIEMASPEDMILIAGKGHEAYQIFAHKTIEFDDAKVASQLCQSEATVKA